MPHTSTIIRITPLGYKGETLVALEFLYDEALTAEVKKLPTLRWLCSRKHLHIHELDGVQCYTWCKAFARQFAIRSPKAQTAQRAEQGGGKRHYGSPTNLKHRAMHSLIYACGYRRSELLNFDIEHLDSKRGSFIIKDAKGRKVGLELINKVIEMLKEYYSTYKPKQWLLEGQFPDTQYNARSLEQVLKNALKQVCISKSLTLKWLRHSYASHLLESGTNIRDLQELLGHRSSKTAEIGTHVSQKIFQKNEYSTLQAVGSFINNNKKENLIA